MDHIVDYDKILTKLEDVYLTLLGVKSMFEVDDVLIVMHSSTCVSYMDASHL